MAKLKKDIEIKYYVRMKAPIDLRREITIESIEGTIVTSVKLPDDMIDDFLQKISTSELKELITNGSIEGKDWIGDYFGN